MEVSKKIKETVIEGEKKDYGDLIDKAKDEGLSATDIVDIMAEAMDIVGDKFDKGDFYLPQVITSANAFNGILEIIEPDLREDISGSGKGKVVIGVVEGDVHKIGKNLVSTLLDAAGFSVVDLGDDVKSDEFINTAKEEEADIIGLSTMMTTTMSEVEEVVDRVEEESLNEQTKTIIGGGPCSQEYANEIGADGYAKNAQKAVKEVSEILEV
ncbi:MAG: Trimethylamine corrinoid protein MtbC1 [Candidatus Methanohalarchaeum thermophilum]|uniref:Trimethylamine corrinoid protein MtbC1 n=1 Tax=Methanohalarchaeum thermophilum TaxID=1903181 RepID=A0A1Q6DRT2_METT1|nr:MAG: Trimethylamine corrinoid protein MtbC1 [Candidatus Methanohalarchaeum thermophilum]